MITLTSREQNTFEIRNTISEILEVPLSRIHYNPIKRTATIELKRNRHVAICMHQLEQMKRKFNCKDIIVHSPYRCVIELKFWIPQDKKCCEECSLCKKNTNLH